MPHSNKRRTSPESAIMWAAGHDQGPRQPGGGGNWQGPGPDDRHRSAPGFGGPPAFHGGYALERGPGAPKGDPLEAGRGRGFGMARGRHPRGAALWTLSEIASLQLRQPVLACAHSSTTTSGAICNLQSCSFAGLHQPFLILR